MTIRCILYLYSQLCSAQQKPSRHVINVQWLAENMWSCGRKAGSNNTFSHFNINILQHGFSSCLEAGRMQGYGAQYLSGYDVPLQSRHSLCTPITPAPAALYFGALPLSSAECSAEEADQIQVEKTEINQIFFLLIQGLVLRSHQPNMQTMFDEQNKTQSRRELRESLLVYSHFMDL